jgi:hypothetical protein
VVLQVMEFHLHDAGVQEKACGALKNLVANGEFGSNLSFFFSVIPNRI